MAPADDLRPHAPDAALAARRAPKPAWALPPCCELGGDGLGRHGRGSVFDRLGQAAHDDEAHAGRRSVFDRIQGAPAELLCCCC